MDNVIQMWLEPVDFDGDSLVVAGEGDTRWVPIRQICLALGLEQSSQQRRLESDQRFNLVHMNQVGLDGKDRRMLCLALDQLNGWLFSINARRVHPSRREKLLKYQMECQRVLFKHFMPNGGSADEIAGIFDFWQNSKAEARAEAEGLVLDQQRAIVELESENDRLKYEIETLKAELGELYGTSSA